MSLNSIPCDLFVDISGADCEMPFSKLNDALEVLLPGQMLMAVSKQQVLQNDIPGFCRQRNLQLVDQGESDGQFYFLIEQRARG
jgi:TusA-related sulfurtransferase